MMTVGKIASTMKNRKGFTLVELMVVLVIIGILVAIAIPLYSASQKTAKDRANQANIRIIEGAISQYLADNPNESRNDVTQTDIEDGEYLKAWPNSPATYTIDAGNVNAAGEW